MTDTAADAMRAAGLDAPGYDVIVIGAGPAGLSAALNLVRARRRTLLLDSNRPRNSATLEAHGFLTRDRISPLELRRLGLGEVLGYPDAEHRRTVVGSVSPVDGGFLVSADAPGSGERTEARARAVLIATGLVETLPALPTIRAFYGTSLHSCVECDGYEKRDAPVAFIGETADVAERALLVAQWTDDLVVFTNGSDAAVTADEEHALAARGIRVERRPIRDVTGDRSGMTGVVLDDGETVPRTGGFVRPRWTAALEYAESLGLERDGDGLVVVDADGRTSVPGVYAAGDTTPPGPQQLIVAAGAGARAAAAINRDLLAGVDGAALAPRGHGRHTWSSSGLG